MIDEDPNQHDGQLQAPVKTLNPRDHGQLDMRYTKSMVVKDVFVSCRRRLLTHPNLDFFNHLPTGLSTMVGRLPANRDANGAVVLLLVHGLVDIPSPE